jgi:hypothetical protein
MRCARARCSQTLTPPTCTCRGLIPKVKEALAQAPASTRAALVFLRLWDDLHFLLEVHMRHEDDVIFPTADGWIPHHSDPFASVRRPAPAHHWQPALQGSSAHARALCVWAQRCPRAVMFCSAANVPCQVWRGHMNA